MDLRAMSTERLLGLSARLLALAAVLVAVGFGSVVRLMWQQTGQAFGSDGSPTGSSIALGTRVMIMVAETGYRPLAVQLLFAAVLVAAAVGVLHRQAERSRSRWARWEVLAAGVVVLVPVVGMVLAHAFVMTSDDADLAVTGGYIGPQPLSALTLANLAICAASLALLAGSSLWWLNLGHAADESVDEESTDEDDTSSDEASGDEASGDAEPTQERRTTSVARDDSTDGATVDYSRDWSPEDFRPPR